MMDIYNTPPNTNLELAHLGDRYFCLAQHYLNNMDYRKFFDDVKAEGKKHITLDNGGGDLEQVSRADLAMCARMLMPNEVIPIDILGDSHKTLLELDLAKSWVPKGVDILFCPQGATIGDYFNCFGRGVYDKAVSRMAISKFVTKLLTGDALDTYIEEYRPKLFSALHIVGLVVKPVHLLGLGTPRELKRYNSKVTSADSCLATWSAMNGQVFDTGGMLDRIPTPKDYFERAVDNPKLVEHNVAFLKNIWDKRWAATHKYNK